MGKSLDFVKSYVLGNAIPDIPARCASNIYQVNSEIQELFNDTYRKIWEETGLICQPKDTNTGATKKVLIRYDPNADFSVYQTKAGICTTDEVYFIPLMAATFADIMYSNINDYTKMPEDYDNDDSDVYWDYDIECIVGDFCFYREENPAYRFLERLDMMEGDNGGLANNRIVTILPMVINYLPVGSITIKEDEPKEVEESVNND